MKLSNGAYDVLKWVSLVLLPAAATLYFAVAQIWGLPMAEQVVGTIVAVDTFLGALLGLSSHKYTPPVDGTLSVSDAKEVVAGVRTPTEDLIKRGTVTLEVHKH